MPGSIAVQVARLIKIHNKLVKLKPRSLVLFDLEMLLKLTLRKTILLGEFFCWEFVAAVINTLKPKCLGCLIYL